eukprot:GHVU01162440.1.p1 GENE.GHVU01162440.1~~GHVU01162440.1.p1  ORF type:complete len:270 (-),score=35.16 GHVU01162440.1:653-1462(-)
MGNTIPIPFENLQCQHALCSEDYYELDWFSKKTWTIELSKEEHNLDNKDEHTCNQIENKKQGIQISKGKVLLKNMKNISLLFHRKINIKEEEISTLLIPYHYIFECQSKFDVYILINNDQLSLCDMENYISKIQNHQNLLEPSYLFHFCFHNHVLQVPFQNNQKEDEKSEDIHNNRGQCYLPILCNFLNRHLLNITTSFHHITTNKNNVLEENKTMNLLSHDESKKTSHHKLHSEEKNILLEDLTDVHFYFYFKIQQLEKNEFISFYLS